MIPTPTTIHFMAALQAIQNFTAFLLSSGADLESATESAKGLVQKIKAETFKLQSEFDLPVPDGFSMLVNFMITYLNEKKATLSVDNKPSMSHLEDAFSHSVKMLRKMSDHATSVSKAETTGE